MMRDRYIYLQSNESNEYFSENQTGHFNVQLKAPLYLDGSWKVALVNFHASEKTKSKASNGLYIYSDICGESIVKGEARPLLRRLEKNKKNGWDFTLDTPYYVPVRRKEIREIEIHIKQEDDTTASDLVKPLRQPLHLKRYPFL